jgi:mannose-1-phosphate guanylyltransferase/mannose-1-phosphate guanylyltransferase/mannose-6-phosphate isomerase
MFNDCIIMAGGSGTRLWPASNSRKPKQFLSISEAASQGNTPGNSFFSSAVERALSVIDRTNGRVIIIAGKNHVKHVVEACSRFSDAEKKQMVLIPEPIGKNTAPAIACGATYIDWAAGEERNVLVLTSDHIIQPLETFKIDASAAEAFAQQDKLVVFGIPPAKPETGYGYIETAKKLSIPREGEAVSRTHRLSEPDVYSVASFREKPDLKTAKKFIASKKFCWNSGMFAFSSRFILGEFRHNAQDVIRPFEKLRSPDERAYRMEKGLRILEEWQDLENAYRASKAISFDYAIAEKCADTVMVSAGFDWIDVGNWDEYALLLSDSQSGNTGPEVYQSKDTDGCFVDSDIPVALAGVKDLIVVVRSGKDGSPPAVLITQKGETQKVREVVEKIKAAGRTDLL